MDLRHPFSHFNTHHLSSFSLPSLAEGSEAISEAEEIKEVKSLQEKANKAACKEHFSEALKYFQEALDIDQRNVAILHDRCLVFLQMGLHNEARLDAESVILLNPGYPDGHFVLGLCHLKLNQYKDGLISFLNALDLDLGNPDKLTNHIVEASSHFCGMPEEFTKSLKEMDAYKKLCEVGVCLFQSKKYVLCIRVLESAQKIQTNQKGITMKVLLTMANAHTSLKHQNQAIPLYLDCLTLAVATHDQLYQTKSLVNIATLYLEAGETHQAIIFYEKLLHLKGELLSEVGSEENLPDFWTRELQSGLHLNLSIAYKCIGNMHAAAYHARKYNTILNDFGVGGRNVAESHHNTGMLNEILGNYDEAVEQYKSYLSLSKKNGNKKGMAQAYGCLGTVYAALRNWALSLTYHEQYIKMATKSADSRMLAISHEMLGDTLMVKGDYELAGKQYEAMMSACVRTDYRTKCTGLCKLGHAYRAQSKKQYSLYFYEQACDLAKEFGYPDVQVLSEYNIACIQQTSTQMQDIEQALKYFQKLIPFYEGKIHEHVEEDTYCPVEYYEQLLECYDGVQSVLSKLGSKEESLQYAECYRKRCVTQLENFSTSSRHPMSGLVRTDMWTVERMNRAVTQQNGTILYYSLLDSALLLWILQPGQGLVRFYTGKAEKNTSMRKQIEQLITEIISDYNVDNLVNQCENRALPLPDADLKHVRRKNLSLSKESSCDTLEQTGLSPGRLKKSAQRQLYNLLFAPVEDILSKLEPMSHLLIVPDKELLHCPFGVLENWNSVLVMDRFRITYLPCLLLLETVLRNEMDLLRVQDQTQFDRSRSRKGGTNLYLSQDDMTPCTVTPSDDVSLAGFERVNLKHVSNPRLFNSLKSPLKSVSPRGCSREATFNSRVSMAVSERGRGMTNSGFSPISKKTPIVGQPMSAERVVGLQSFSTLTIKTATGTDIITSTDTIPLYQQISNKEGCMVYGCPRLTESVQLHGKSWRPMDDLKVANQEVRLVSGYLDVDPVLEHEATKDSFLAHLGKATVVHIATYGCWTENLLALTPSKVCREKETIGERSYLVSPADIHSVKMCAQLVVLNCGYNPWRREFIPSYSLPAAFLAAGAQCVLVTQWQVPDAAMDKFYHHFYLMLQHGCLVTVAVKAAMHALRVDERFSHIYNWCPFILIGKDTEVNVKDIRHAMLDQKLDQAEAVVQTETGRDFLNPRNVVAHVPTKEENFETLQQHLREILMNEEQQPMVIPGLIDLLDAALKRLHTEENNKQTTNLPSEVASGVGSMGLLRMLGFHFQAMGAALSDPWIIYPHWNKDEMLIPAFDSLRALIDIISCAQCVQALCEVLPLSQDHVSLLVDLMSITKHAPEIQLKVTDLSVRPLWHNTKIKRLLTATGFHQIGLLLNFNMVPGNRLLLTSLLQLLLALSCYKSQVLLYRLDVNLLGRSPSASKQTLYSSMDLVKLPSLTPLILPRNQLRMSTPWQSTVERENEMTEKVKLARSKSNLDEDYEDYLERAKTWHQMTIAAQANESLRQFGRPKTTPMKVKVVSGGSASGGRIPIKQEHSLAIKEVDQRRDYANYILQQRMENIGMRHKDEIMKLYLPYVKS